MVTSAFASRHPASLRIAGAMMLGAAALLLVSGAMREDAQMATSGLTFLGGGLACVLDLSRAHWLAKGIIGALVLTGGALTVVL